MNATLFSTIFLIFLGNTTGQRLETEEHFFERFGGEHQISDRIVPAEFIVRALKHPGRARFLLLDSCHVVGALKVDFEVPIKLILKNTTVWPDAEFVKGTSKGLEFDGSRFEGDLRLVEWGIKGTFHAPGVVFARKFVLDQVGLEGGELRLERATFTGTTSISKVAVRGTTYFSGATIGSEFSIFDSAFHSNVLFERVKGRRAKVDIAATTFHSTFYGNGAHLRSLRLTRRASPVFFEKAAVLHGLRGTNVSFDETEFLGYVDLTRATIGRRASFVGAHFAGDVNFAGAAFPVVRGGDTGVLLDRVRFDQYVHLDWEQLSVPRWPWCFWDDRDVRIAAPNPATWATIESAFRRAGNLEAENESHYMRYRAERWGVGKFTSYLVWGFGRRPWRVVFWLALLWLACAALYRRKHSQIGALTSGHFRAALEFSGKVAWRLGYGTDTTGSRLLQTVMWAESITFKVLLLVFIAALANVLPLWHSVVRGVLSL